MLEIRKLLASEIDSLPELASSPHFKPDRNENHKVVDEVDGFYAAFLGDAFAGGMIFNTSFFRRGFIWVLWTEEGFRRRGVATALIRRAESICPAPAIFTSTNQSNVAAQRLFESLGFARSGMLENLDPGDPEIFYFKPLSRGADALPGA